MAPLCRNFYTSQNKKLKKIEDPICLRSIKQTQQAPQEMNYQISQVKNPHRTKEKQATHIELLTLNSSHLPKPLIYTTYKLSLFTHKREKRLGTEKTTEKNLSFNTQDTNQTI